MAFVHFTTACLYAIIFLKFSLASDTLFPNQTISKGQTLISQSQIFELGFFSPAGESRNSFLGIWYKNTPEVVVWVANRNNPITGSEGLTLSVARNGTIVIIRDIGGIIWRTNSSGVAAVNPLLQLLDTGNLVVVDDGSKASSDERRYIWQSFDYPTDTRLPGMPMEDNPDTGVEKYLTSWKNPNDPSLGNFTYRIENKGLPQLVILRGTTKVYRTGQWNGLYLNGIPHSGTIFKYVKVTNIAGWTSITEPYNRSTFPSRLTMEQSGLLQRYNMNERRDKWNLVYTVPRDLCDTYGQCGPNGVCQIDKDPICKCLKGFESKGRLEDLDWSAGCARIRPINCESGDGFLGVEGVKFPEMVKFWLNTSMSLVECRDECLKNCGCTAYANAYVTDGGTGCLIWYGDLIDIKEISGADTKQVIYIRLPLSELGSDNNLGMKKRRRMPGKLVLILTVTGVLIFCFICCCIFVKLRLKKQNRALAFPIFSTAENMKSEDFELPSFKLAAISAATNNFSSQNLLGEGGFGPVYRGNLSVQEEIAVKRLSEASTQGLEEFKNEVVLIAKLQHRNLVRVLGCCIEGDERLLIYEYMQNRSLDYFVFDENRRKLLTWPKRFNIIMGISRGLLYLHHDSRLKIIHRDLKTSNILLDENLNPKISDFGLARIFGGDQTTARTKRVIGTYGYMAPEYAIDGKFSIKSDVFSMGVVLLEIVSGKKNRDFNHCNHYHSLLGHAWLLWKENRVMELMDECLENTCSVSQVKRCIQVGLLCIQKFQDERPDMSSVLFMLGSEGAILPEPREPGFFIERSSSEDNHNHISSTGTESSTNSTAITILEPR